MQKAMIFNDAPLVSAKEWLQNSCLYMSNDEAINTMKKSNLKGKRGKKFDWNKTERNF